ncbi:MAG: Rieske (2Fe-2S) protein [Chloroflexota bacterium]
MNRRDFLNIPLETEPPPQPAPIITTPEAGYPRNYARHTCVLVENARAWLCRDELGFYAVDALCPHLGGMIRSVGDGFVCLCHTSRFTTSGNTLSGPAKRPLRYFQVDLDSAGKLFIRREQIVSPDDRFFA